MGVITSLSDSVAMKQVAAKSVSYGSMRLFGTLGWGTGAFFAGVVNDERTQKYLPIKLPLYVPGLILIFGLLIIVDIVFVVIKFNQNKSSATDANVEINLKEVENSSEERVNKEEDKTSISVPREILTAFSKYPSLYQYTFIATVVGILTGFHWTYFYWLLAALVGERDTILPGLCNAVQTFCGELPFFLFAENIVNKIGCSMSLNISLLAFAVRYFCYAYLVPIVPPYFVLIVELTQGPAFGLFYSVITKIAQEYAIKAATNDNQSKSQRTFATMQGIMGGFFEGAGVGIGGLLGGLLIDNWKLSGVWLTGAILAVITVIINVFIEMIKSKRNSTNNVNEK
ncbi:major facilitator superfamily domain-containing protein 6-like protein [Leptotrombidium deliense]|uniref:Major facilitator superfamily domain-containing protein 6-like protein n=1 Tax=Leptotrombidium deliense TaxID=299467 RepID=A0A443SSC7_9ACAR|nr:major facilitator superfamily domain-containing protein 6-like protein [Leptotrombidium deliense]